MTDLNALKNKFGKASEELGETAKEKASSTYDELKSNAESFAHQVKEKTVNLYEEGVSKAGELQNCAVNYTEDFIKRVKDKPVKSVLVAAGIGYILSNLLSK